MKYERLNKMSEYSITVHRIVEQEAVVVIDTEDEESIEDLTAMAIESLDEYDWEIIKVLETKDF
tara:strand:+ start:395 stop:586 length:192 start_codon:yes stop_codon:yes gene_type:complete